MNEDFGGVNESRLTPLPPSAPDAGVARRGSVPWFNRIGKAHFPDLLGIEVTDVSAESLRATLAVKPEHLAPNGYLHAGVVVTLADTAAGYGCVANLPDGAKGFTTIELKSNFLGTARSGTIVADAKATHLGRSTQLWDVVVTDERGRTIALFRCTQMVLRQGFDRIDRGSGNRG